MEYGEVKKSNNVFEVLNEWNEGGERIIAALGYQALAMNANNSTLADAYFDKSVQSLASEDKEAPIYGSIPSHEAVQAKALLNLASITREFVVRKTISGPEVVRDAFTKFISDLGKQERAAKNLLLGPQPESEPLANERGLLIATFNNLAVLGLLMRFQIDDMKSDDWIALPAFLEPELVRRDDRSLVAGYWGISIYSGFDRDIRLTNKIYVRASHQSLHRNFTDPETMVVWVLDDLSLPNDKIPATELAIIRDLESRTNKGRERVSQRVSNLMEIIDKRTLSSVWDKVPHYE